MIELKGKYGTAKVFSDFVEYSAQAQIIELLNSPSFEGSKVRIMSDVHAGAGCVIGFTADIGDKIVPNLIGVDISCGMLTVNMGDIDIDFASLDYFIRRNIPFGTGSINTEIDSDVKNDTNFVSDVKKICDIIGIDSNKALKGVGSLGSGNHFIEINTHPDTEDKYLVIHSGSRNFGFSIAKYYHKLAVEYCTNKSIKIYQSLSFIEGELKDVYLHDMYVAEKYATLSRKIMAKRILGFLNIKDAKMFETIHNYISSDDNIIRKGAISAKKGERVLIPINMSVGSILGIGKGNSDWNESGPHGAGRPFSRAKAKSTLSIADFEKSMIGIWSSCISENTLDEAPDAYKSLDAILDNIGDSIEIEAIMKPVYNFKG